MMKRVGDHTMKSDEGRTYVVHEYQEFIDTGSKDGDRWTPGMKFLKLGDGSAVNCIDEQTFQIVQTGTILRRIIAK